MQDVLGNKIKNDVKIKNNDIVLETAQFSSYTTLDGSNTFMLGIATVLFYPVCYILSKLPFTAPVWSYGALLLFSLLVALFIQHKYLVPHYTKEYFKRRHEGENVFTGKLLHVPKKFFTLSDSPYYDSDWQFLNLDKSIHLLREKSQTSHRFKIDKRTARFFKNLPDNEYVTLYWDNNLLSRWEVLTPDRVANHKPITVESLQTMKTPMREATVFTINQEAIIDSSIGGGRIKFNPYQVMTHVSEFTPAWQKSFSPNNDTLKLIKEES